MRAPNATCGRRYGAFVIEIREMESGEHNHGAGFTIAQKHTLRFFSALSAMQLAAHSLAGAVRRSNAIYEESALSASF